MDGKARPGRSAVPQSVVDPTTPILPLGCFNGHWACLPANTCHHHYVFLGLPSEVDRVAVAPLDGIASATAFEDFFRLHVLATMRTLAPSGTGAFEEDLEDDPLLEDAKESESEESPNKLLFEESVAPASFAGFQSQSSVPTEACRRLPNKCPLASVGDSTVGVVGSIGRCAVMRGTCTYVRSRNALTGFRSYSNVNSEMCAVFIPISEWPYSK